MQEARYEFFENEWKHISAEAKDIITRLLVADPKKRMTMAELLEHAWVKEAAAKCRVRMEEKAKLGLRGEAKAPKEATAAANATPQRAGSEERSGVPTCSGCALL